MKTNEDESLPVYMVHHDEREPLNRGRDAKTPPSDPLIQLRISGYYCQISCALLDISNFSRTQSPFDRIASKVDVGELRKFCSVLEAEK